MNSWSRRDVLRVGVPALAAAAIGGRGLSASPQPYRRWHGESSVGAALRLPAAAQPPLVAQVARQLGPPETASPLSFDQDFLGPGLGKLPPPRLRRNPAARLAARFPNLRRHFVFEYYAWYRAAPWVHWNEGGHTPPDSLASPSVPALGPYDSRDTRVIEQHARWMADAGAGAIALSWWGQGSSDDALTHHIMDIMRAHDLHVTFHLEPYRDDRARHLTADVLYLLREYGDKRRWDNFLLLEFADGTSAPVLKGFRTILPQTFVDCRGVTRSVPDYTPDAVWRAQFTTLRQTLGAEFPRFMFLADSLDVGRTRNAGFDGIAIYDSYVRPDTWPLIGATFDQHALVSSFSINCGFDGYLPKVPRGECDIPLDFEPPVGQVNWNSDASRAVAEAASRDRVLESLAATMTVQTTTGGANDRQGVFLAFVNTFNEWHEGTAFEPALNRRDLSAAQRAQGYHNPDDGAWRLRLLESTLTPITSR